MKFSTHLNPLGDLKNHATEILEDNSEKRRPMLNIQYGEVSSVVMDVKNHREREEMLVMLKILAFGNREIELGKFRPAEVIFSEMDK